MYLSVGIIILASASCKTDSGRKEYSSVLVKTLTVGNRDSVEYVKYPGVINSEKEVTIAFKVNGQIAFLPENEGMSFRKGSIIATLDKHDFEVQYNAAKAVSNNRKKRRNAYKPCLKITQSLQTIMRKSLLQTKWQRPSSMLLKML